MACLARHRKCTCLCSVCAISIFSCTSWVYTILAWRYFSSHQLQPSSTWCATRSHSAQPTTDNSMIHSNTGYIWFQLLSLRLVCSTQDGLPGNSPGVSQFGLNLLPSYLRSWCSTECVKLRILHLTMLHASDFTDSFTSLIGSIASTTRTSSAGLNQSQHFSRQDSTLTSCISSLKLNRQVNLWDTNSQCDT